MIAIPPLDFSSIDNQRFRQHLREAISVFNEIGQPLQHRIVDFLVTGHDVEVLLDLRQALREPNRPKFFRLHEDILVPLNSELGCKLLKLFKQPITPPGYYHRLGQVCSQHPDLEHARFSSDSRLPKWFNDLVRFAITLCYDAPRHVKYEETKCECGPIFASLNAEETQQLLRIHLESCGHYDKTFGRALGYLSGNIAYIEQQFDRLMAICRADEQLQEQLVILLRYQQAIPTEYLPEVIDIGLEISRGNRSVFQEVLERNRVSAKPILLQRLISGTPIQRTRAADWLNKLFGRAIAGNLADALTQEKDRKVYAHIESLYCVYREAEEYERALAVHLTLPDLEMPSGELPLPSGFAVKFQAYLDIAFAREREQYKQALHSHANSEPSDAQHAPTRPSPPSSDDLLSIYLYMEGKSTDKPPKNSWLFRVLQEAPAIDLWCAPQELHLLHVMRLLDAIGSLQERSSALAVYHFNLLNAHRRAQATPYGLREIDAAAEQIFDRPHLMSRGYLMESARYELEDDAIWPAFACQLKLIEDSIAGVPFDQYDRDVTGRRQTALAIAGMLPVLPKQIEEAAWALALADGWTLRPLARPLLKRQANCLQRAIMALTHRSGGARMGAAELLQELGQPEAIDPLKRALRKEKLLPVQGYLLSALDHLGANVDEFIGREKLHQEALNADRRPTRSMMWFPMKKVPPVRWAADDEQLPPLVLEWWLLQCVSFQSTTCSPIMRRALSMCRRDDTLRLAHFILDEWISFDTDVPDRGDLEAKIRGQAQNLFSVFKAAGKSSSPSLVNLETHIQRMVNEELRILQRQQSAHPERGLLAIVAAFGDGQCVEKMEAYIRNYHGNRALQAKSILEVIPQIDDPRSLRVMCSLAAGFRNSAICKRAGELLRDMAQRYGWTEDELAERIIPDAGFAIPACTSESRSIAPPEMVLNYGHRQFRAIVNNDFEAVVHLADGTPVRELPAAKKDDDKTLVRVAKAQLKTSRQVLQSTKEQLTERLFKAMCSGRTWKVKDWRALLAEHVLAGIACRRLVWSVQSDRNQLPTFFQLLADGTTVDASGQLLMLADDCLISVAHPNRMEPSMEQFWCHHLATQGITPLFPQTCDSVNEEINQRD